MTTAAIPNPATGFTFDEAGHICRDAQGVIIPTVTQVLADCGMYDFSMVPPEVLERKAQLGRLVHQACHYFDEGDLDESGLHPEVHARLQGYKQFRADTGYEPAVHERRHIFEVHGMRFSGQYDSVGTRGKENWLVDIKNAASFSPCWGLQTAAYELGLPSRRLCAPFNYRRVVVQLFADGRYKLHTFSDGNDKQVFLACLAVATWKRNHKLA